MHLLQRAFKVLGEVVAHGIELDAQLDFLVGPGGATGGGGESGGAGKKVTASCHDDLLQTISGVLRGSG